MAVMGNIGTWWAPDLVVAETPWRHSLVEGGGMALDLGPHFFDLIRYISGSEVDDRQRPHPGRRADPLDPA
jgi:predicted dehydrogenase